MKRIALLGSTGSIGENTLRVAKHLGERIQVTALAVHSNIDRLEEQIKEFSPSLVAVFDTDQALRLQKRVPHLPVLAGMDGLIELVQHEAVDQVVSAMSGTLGLLPTYRAAEAGKDIALANKEALVSGGALLMDCIRKHNVQLLPIDSEHSALFQCLNGEEQKSVRRLILTASGGPFRDLSLGELDKVSVEHALQHPTWTMGAKNTIDSSTLMNKGLELIETHWMFGIPIEQIEVIIHPQSVIHSMVEFCDHSMMAQMSAPSMITPIQYALTYPDRYPSLLKPFDFMQHSTLEFMPVDIERFRCLQVACNAIVSGGSAPC